MITVCGETVADLVVQPDGDYRAYPGGGPANTALALARLGQDVTLLARLGPDVFGQRMRAHLTGNGVDPRDFVAAAEPSALAVASLDAEGRASYDFWVAGAADWQWQDADFAAHPRPGTLALHTGSLASWTPPGDEVIRRFFTRAREAGDVTLSYDPNVRPLLLGDRAEGRARIESMVALAHVVKVSDEDLGWLHPGADPVAVATSWLDTGPALVVVTRGAEGAVAVRPGDVVEVAARRVDVVDTVGAGDTFGAGLLHALAGLGALGADPAARLAALTADQLLGVLTTAVAAAALTCQRPGCDPPTRAALEAALAEA